VLSGLSCPIARIATNELVANSQHIAASSDEILRSSMFIHRRIAQRSEVQDVLGGACLWVCLSTRRLLND